MELRVSDIEVHSKGVASKTQFRVASSAKVMDMLSNQLYKNKIAAVIREVSTNAIDSHISAGCQTKPFDVHLPCVNNSEFRIRDFGKGMTVNELETLYTTYGLSDKNDSNEYIGCLGIGSKSPFCVGDSFSVISYRDGVKYIYIASKDSQGIPTLNKMSEDKTDEPNGMEIAFSVKKTEFESFYQNAKNIYKHFPVLPNISGYRTDLALPKQEVLLQGSGWRLYSGNSESSTAVMGYVAYPIDPKFFSKFVNDGGWYGKYYDNDNTEAQLLNLGLEIHFPIGSIEVDIGREGLQYTKETIDEIKRRLALIRDEIAILVEEHFKACTTAWEARCVYNDLFRNRLGQLSNVAKIVKPTWNGVNLLSNPVIKADENLDICYTNHCKAFTRRHTHYDVTPCKTTKFWVNDLKRGVYAMSERDSSDCMIYIVSFKGTDTEQAAAKKYLVETLGIAESQLVYASTLPQLPKSSSNGSRRIKQFEYMSRGQYYGRRNSTCWEETTVDLENDTGYYVVLSGYNVEQSGKTFDTGQFKHIIEYAETLGIKIPTIYGIRPSNATKIKGDPEWTNFFDYLLDELDKFVHKNNHVETLDEIRKYREIDHNRFSQLLNYVNKVSNQKTFGNFLTNFRRIFAADIKIGNLSGDLTSLANVLEYTLPAQTTQFDCVAELKKLLTVYPMYNFVDNYRLDEKDCERIIQYVNLVDAQKSV